MGEFFSVRKITRSNYSVHSAIHMCICKHKAVQHSKRPAAPRRKREAAKPAEGGPTAIITVALLAPVRGTREREEGRESHKASKQVIGREGGTKR